MVCLRVGQVLQQQEKQDKNKRWYNTKIEKLDNHWKNGNMPHD
jgi:hypothetical protein